MDIAKLLLLFTGENAGAMAAIGEVDAGLGTMQGQVTKTAGGFNLVKAGALALAGTAVAVGAVVAVGLKAASSLVDAGQAAYEMGGKFGLAGSQASAWIAAGAAVGLQADTVSGGFKFLAKNLESLDLLNNAAKMKELNKELNSTNANQVANARGALALADAARPMAEVFSSLGIATHDASGNIRPMNDLMLEVATAFAAMPDGAEKAGLAIKLFGRSGSDLIPLLNEGGAGIVDYMNKAKAMGAVLSDQQVAAAHSAFLGWEQMKLGLQGLTFTLGGFFLPMLISVIGWMSGTAIPGLERFGKWIAPTLTNAVHWAQSEFAALAPHLEKFGGAVLTAAPYVERIATSLMTGVGPALAALAPVLADAADKLSGSIAPAMKTIADNMDVIKPAIVTIAGTWLVWNNYMAITKGLGIVEWLGQFVIQTTLARGAMAGVGAEAGTMAGALDVLGISEIAVSWPLIAIVALIAGVILIGYLLITHWKQLSSTVQALGTLLGTFFVEVWGKVTAAIGSFFSWLGGRAQAALAAVGGAFSAFGGEVHAIWTRIVDTVEAAARAFWERPFYWITRVVLFIPGLLYQLERRALLWALTMIGHAIAMGTGFVQGAAAWLGKLPGEVEKWLANAALKIVLFSILAVAWAIKTGSDFSLSVGRFLIALPGQVWGWLTGMLDQVGKWSGQFVGWATTTGNSFVTTLKAIDWLGLGLSVLEGIINGIKNGSSWALGQVKNVGGQILQGFKDAFGIKSPSAVMAQEVGAPIAQGIAAGIGANAHLAAGALGSLLGKLPGVGGAGGGGGGGAGSDHDLLLEIRDLLRRIADDTPALTGQAAMGRVG